MANGYEQYGQSSSNPWDILGSEGADLYENYSEEDLRAAIEKLVGMAMADPNSDLAGIGMGRSRELANAPMPEGTHVGGTFVAANPLQFAAASLSRILGEKGWRGGIEEMKSANESRRGGLAEFLSALLRKKKAQGQGGEVSGEMPYPGVGMERSW